VALQIFLQDAELMGTSDDNSNSSKAVSESMVGTIIVCVMIFLVAVLGGVLFFMFRSKASARTPRLLPGKQTPDVEYGSTTFADGRRGTAVLQ
jgi:flagellar basal body-associated protein FliL